MSKMAVFERSRRELFLDVSVDAHILLVVEQSSLKSQSRGCAKTPIFTVLTVLRCKLYLLQYSTLRSVFWLLRFPGPTLAA